MHRHVIAAQILEGHAGLAQTVSENLTVVQVHAFDFDDSICIVRNVTIEPCVACGTLWDPWVEVSCAFRWLFGFTLNQPEVHRGLIVVRCDVVIAGSLTEYGYFGK